MEELLMIFRVAMALVPLVEQAITAVEGVMPPGSGQQKLEAVKTSIQTGMSQVQGIEASFEQVWPTLSMLTNTIVAAKNAAGIFSKVL